MSQAERVFAHLKVFGAITNAQAHDSYGIRHLPAVIRDIKKFYDVEITDHWEDGENRFKEKCRWKVYELKHTA